MNKNEELSQAIATTERQISEAPSELAKKTLTKKLERLKEELRTGEDKSTSAISTLSKARKEVRNMANKDFKALITKLSKKPEYAFLENYSVEKLKDDLKRVAKPKGYRFVGENTNKPTISQIKKGLKDGTVYYEGRPIRSDVSRVVQLKEGGKVSDVNIKSLEGHWYSYNKGLMGGKKDEGYVTIKNEEDLKDYISKKIGSVVKNIKVLEKGKNYPYNRSNPYYEDTYSVTLKNGSTFEVERSYGRPNWSGNADYKEQISIKNISQMAMGGDVSRVVQLGEGGNTESDASVVAKAIFYPNQKKNKIETGFGDKTLTGLTAMIENDNYDKEEIANTIFAYNEKNKKIETQWGDKTYGGLLAMVSHARDNKLNYHNLGQFKKGGAVEDCIDYIKNSEAIRNNGYYLHINSLNNYIDSGAKIPKIKPFCLITFNSGGQKNLKAIDTINATLLSSEIAKLLNIDIELAIIIVSEQTTRSKRFTMDMLDKIENNNIIVADKETIVCTNLSNKFAEGGGVENDETSTFVVMVHSELGDDQYTVEATDGNKAFQEARYLFKKENPQYRGNVDLSMLDKYAKGGKIGRYNVLNELLTSKAEGVKSVSLNGFNESINYVIELKLDDSEIKKVGENSYITLYAKGGGVSKRKTKGDVGKSGTQYGYTLKEYELASEKYGLFVSPSQFWKSQDGKKYTDSFGRTQTTGERDKQQVMMGYGYRIAIGLDLGSKKIPASAKKYVEENNLSKFAEGGGVGNEETSTFVVMVHSELGDDQYTVEATDGNKAFQEARYLFKKENPQYRGNVDLSMLDRYAKGGGIDSSIEFKPTRITKGFYGWVAKTVTKKPVKGYDWEITTMKRSSGDLVSTANGGKYEDGDGYTTFTFSPFEDPSLRLMLSSPRMVNEKAVTKQHEEAVQIFMEKIKEMKGNEMMHGGRVKAGKVNDKYYINKQGVGKKSKYNVEVHLDGNTEIVSTFIQNGQLRADSNDLPKYVIHKLISLYKQDGHELAYDMKGKVMGAYAEGGMMATGGSIPDNYEGKTAEEVWNGWSAEQRKHFLKDHLVLSGKTEDHRASLYRYAELPSDLLSKIKPRLTEHINEGKYATGGSVGKGSTIQIGEMVFVPSEDREAEVLNIGKNRVTVMYAHSKERAVLEINEVEKINNNANVGGVQKKAEYFMTILGNDPSEDEGYWDNYENATYEDLNPMDGRYAGYKWQSMQGEEGYWEKNEMATGGGIEKHRLFNFLQDDLATLQEAIKISDKQEIERFFSYWGQHLKSLKSESNEKMFNFLSDDLATLETAIKEKDQEEIDKFFSYWGQHLESIKYATGGKVGEKTYNVMHNVGEAKYGVTFHDGVSTHWDGSPFFDWKLFQNLKGLKTFIKKLESEGYKKQMATGGSVETMEHLKNAQQMLSHCLSGGFTRKKWDMIKDEISMSKDSKIINISNKISLGMHSKNSDFSDLYYTIKSKTESKMATGGSVKKYSYLPNKNISKLVLNSGQVIGVDRILDGAYVKGKLLKGAKTKLKPPTTLNATQLSLELKKFAKENFPNQKFGEKKDYYFTVQMIQKLIDAGYNKKDITALMFGLDAILDIKADIAYSTYYEGVATMSADYKDIEIDKNVEAIKTNTFELGLKKPNFDWSKIIEKYKISLKHVEVKHTIDYTSESTAYVYGCFVGENIVIGTTIKRERYKGGKLYETITDDYTDVSTINGEFNEGYWGIVSSQKDIILDVANMLFSQEKGYCKNLSFFYNSLGGVDGSDLIENKIKYAKGGNIDDEVDQLWRGYASAILFAEIDYETEESLDSNYSISDFDEGTEKDSKQLLRKFYTENRKAIEESGLDLNIIGNDVWYTRAGHGAGFFDHSLDSDVEEALTSGAKALGEHPDVETYDGKISVRGGRVFKYADGGGVESDEMSKLAKTVVRGTDYALGLYLPYRTDFFKKGREGRLGMGSFLVLKESNEDNSWSVSVRKYSKEKGGYYDLIESDLTQKEAYKIVKNLIGSKYGIGGGVDTGLHGKFGDDNPRLVNFDLDDLDQYEEMVYNDMKKSNTKAATLQVIINTVEGDYTQLSPQLAEIAEEQFTSEEWDEESNKRYFAKGGGVSPYYGGMSEAEILKATVVYDNGGETLDRYTVFTPDSSVFGMSETGGGFNQYIGDDTEIEKGSHLGKRLKTVPKDIKSAVLNRMIEEEFADGGSMYKKGGKAGYEYIPNEDISKLIAIDGNEYPRNSLLDGAYVTDKVRKPKMSRTQFEDDSYEYGQGGLIEDKMQSLKFELSRLESTLKWTSQQFGVTTQAYKRKVQSRKMTQANANDLIEKARIYWANERETERRKIEEVKAKIERLKELRSKITKNEFATGGKFGEGGGTVLKKGNRVRIVNTKFNGKEGLIISNDLHDGSYLIQMEDGSIKGFPFENLMLLSREQFSAGGNINFEKHIWEGWTVGDFIEDLEPTFNQIMSGRSWQKPFTTKQEVKEWCMDNQPYYKKHIPEVVNYFWAKAEGKFAIGGTVGDYFYDNRKDKNFQVIMEDGDEMTIQYMDRSKKPLGKAETISKNQFEYYVQMGAWGKWKQEYALGGEITPEEREQALKNSPKLNF